MTCSFVVYVDESGDEGFAFGSGGSEWFVLSAAIIRKRDDLETVKLVDRVRALLKRPDHKPLHFRDLRHEHRIPFVAEIARAPLQAVTLLIHKPSIPDPKALGENGRLYYQAVQRLLECVSGCCRDSRQPEDGDGTAEIVLSNRSGMSHEQLRSHLQIPADPQDEETTGFSILRGEQIHIYSAGRRLGLQIADAIASGFFKAVEPSPYGHTEDRYARMLKPVLYRRDSLYLGHGLSFWPREAEGILREEERFEWVRGNFDETGWSRSRAPGSHPIRAAAHWSDLE